jgi:hypothetical protein
VSHGKRKRAAHCVGGRYSPLDMSTLPSKPCARCGRTFTWRKKWARDWEQVRFCSDRCRRAPDDGDAYEAAVLELLSQRAAGATICPSEAARAVEPEAWREHMEDARAAARRLVTRGLVDITQGGQVVDGDRARGPIRVRLRRRG